MSQLLTESPSSQQQVDWGRIVMVPVSVGGGTLSIFHMFQVVTLGSSAATTTTIAATTSALTAMFYALIVWAYLRRGPARSTTEYWSARIAAPFATFLPFALPFLAAGGVPASLVLVGDALLVTGLAWSVWSIRCLDRNLSVVAQAREVVQTGPYAWVRHPLYLGELVAMLGLALTLGGVLPLFAWVLLVGLQAYRAVHEEALLVRVLPPYAAYQQRTARIVPGVF